MRIQSWAAIIASQMAKHDAPAPDTSWNHQAQCNRCLSSIAGLHMLKDIRALTVFEQPEVDRDRLTTRMQLNVMFRYLSRT